MPGSLVSVLIPAHNPAHFEQALASAAGQTFADLEILVSDDSEGEEIRAAVERCGDPRIRYLRNESNPGFSGNFSHCLASARGEYIKFLNDDDLLHPECVARMVAAFEEYGEEVRLVTSRRRIIDDQGRPQEDTLDTQPLCPVDALLRGRDVGDLLLRHGINFIGEPTTAMFRKSDLSWDGQDIFRLGGDSYTCLADVSLWLRLLSRGRMVYLAGELSRFRVHAGQEQKKPEVAVRCVTERCSILEAARSLGFLENPAAYAAALRTVLDLYRRSMTARGLAPALRQILAEGERWMARELESLGD